MTVKPTYSRQERALTGKLVDIFNCIQIKLVVAIVATLILDNLEGFNSNMLTFKKLSILGFVYDQTFKHPTGAGVEYHVNRGKCAVNATTLPIPRTGRQSVRELFGPTHH